MLLRSSAFFVLLLVCICAAALSQTSDPPNPNIPKSFHDPLLSVTYFYPGRFTPDPESIAPKPGSDGAPQCAHSTLSANSVTPVDPSSFVLSTIDNTSPYAAKACVLGNIPVKPKKKSDPVDPTRHVLCFDFTTLHKDLYTLMFAFSMQFDNDPPQPMVPGSVIR